MTNDQLITIAETQARRGFPVGPIAAVKPDHEPNQAEPTTPEAATIAVIEQAAANLVEAHAARQAAPRDVAIAKALAASKRRFADLHAGTAWTGRADLPWTVAGHVVDRDHTTISITPA